MDKPKTEKHEIPKDFLRRDWLNLGLTSALFSLVAKKTVPRPSLGKYEESLSRLTVNQVKIFGHIVTNAAAEIRVKQLAHDLDITPAAASQAIERLVSVNMLERQTDPNDRRSFIITISKQGREILDEYRSISSSLLESIYKSLNVTQDELATFSKVLNAIHNSLETRWLQYLNSKDKASQQKEKRQ